jgi:hypothetical protein
MQDHGSNSADLAISRKSRHDIAATREFLGVFLKLPIMDHAMMTAARDIDDANDASEPLSASKATGTEP